MALRWREIYLLWVAQGFGLGRIPVAPGTFGSLAGLLWFAVLLETGRWYFFLAGTLLGLFVSVWFCGKAEQILKQTDPSSVVLDELSAMPVCFLSYVFVPLFRSGQWPGLDAFFSASTWPATGIVFVLFRIFDILKPWPVRGSQKLPGGWGVTVDDFLAALYVAIVTLLLAW